MAARYNPAGTGAQLQPHDNNHNDPQDRYSGAGAVGMGFLTGDIDDDDDDDSEIFQKPANHPPGLTPQGRPGPAVVSQNFQAPPSKPSAAKIPDALRLMTQPQLRQQAPAPVQISFGNQQQQPRSQMRAPPPAMLNLPQLRSPPTPGPMSPHPLQAPKEPITVAFARPRPRADPADVKFAPDAILRGEKEETLLARNTPKGAEFWRRFSVVVKEEQKHPSRLFKSNWLSDHQSRSFRMNLCVWLIALFLVALLAGGGVLIWFLTSSNSVTAPKSLEGNAGKGNDNPPVSSGSGSASQTAFHYSTVKGDVPPSSTPPVPAGLTRPTPAPGAAAPAAAVNKRSLRNHRQMMRRLASDLD